MRTVKEHMMSELETARILTSKPFSMMNAKMQALFNQPNLPSIISTRLTHCHETANSAVIMGLNNDKYHGWPAHTTDYKGSLRPCALIHDLGHPPLAHSGAVYLDSFFRSMGLDEGFCDNNNTLTIIEKNNMNLSSYTIASVIKYPDKIYPSQREKYRASLAKEISNDHEHFLHASRAHNSSNELSLNGFKRTVACEIMDVADRNTYITSDLSDFFCLGGGASIPSDDVFSIAKEHKVNIDGEYFQAFFGVLSCKNKNQIRTYFNDLQNAFNTNYILTNDGMKEISLELHEFREFLWELEFRYFITPAREDELHLANMDKLKLFVHRVVDDGFAPSRTYSSKIKKAKSKFEKLRAQRDMIAESTDYYITQPPQ
jgi:hypothetical protein